MFATLMALALSQGVAAKPGAAPVWNTDYRQARALAIKEQKPMAVVIGQGESGWDKLFSDSDFATTVSAEQRNAYVWVYLDLSQDAGKKMAANFELTKGPALVLSDRGGNLQAYRRAGAIEASAIRKVLNTYAEANRVIKNTEEAGEIAPKVYQSNYQPWQSTCPNCRPF
jgi:predicted transcriptional regulator